MPSTNKFVDFSKSYFKNNLPPQRGGKFVMIRGEGTLHLVFSPKGLDSYHANIVERFSLLKGALAGAYAGGRDYFRLDEPGWTVEGGGYWKIDKAAKKVRFAGESKAYGRFDREALRRLVSGLGEFEGYGVKVE